MNTQDIKAITHELFGVSFRGEEFQRDKAKLQESAENLIEEAGWDATYEA